MENLSIPNAIARIEALPTLPTVLTLILTTVANPDASALDLARHITADQALAASLLRIVNSAYYGFKREIVRIPDAIVILGFTEVRNLALAATAFEAFPDAESVYDRTQLWRHSIATAIAADRTARAARLLNPDAYFVAGLLHDIGKVVFDVLQPEKFRVAALRAHAQKTRIFETEQQVFRCDHTALGAALSKHWHLPELINAAIQNHHLAEIDASLTESSRVVAVANSLTYEAGLGEASNGIRPDHPIEPAQSLGVTEDQLAAIVEELREASMRIDCLIGAIPEE